MSILVRFYQRIMRGLFFFRLGFTTHAYDYGYTEDILLQSLKKQYELFVGPRSFVDWNEGEAKKSLKALRVCIKLLEKKEFSFKDTPRLKYRYEDNKDGTSTMVFENSEEEKSFILEHAMAEDRIQEKRRVIAYNIIIKYSMAWWD